MTEALALTWADQLAAGSELLEAIGDGVVIHAASGEAVAWNTRALDDLGLTADQLRGTKSTDPLWRAEREDGAPLSLELLPASVARTTGRNVLDVRVWVRVGKGPRRLLFVSARALRGERTQAPYPVVATFRDITAEHERDLLARQVAAQHAERAASQASLGQATLLAELTRVLVSTLDQQMILTRTMATLAPSIVPYAACIRHDLRGHTRHLDQAGDADMVAALEPLLREGEVPDAHPVSRARWMRRPQAVAVESLNDAERLLGAYGDALPALAALLPLRLVAAPLVVHGEHHAVILLAATGREAGPRLPDTLLLEDIVSRLELALSNARSFEEARREIQERRRADAALRLSEVSYRTVATLASDAVLDVDLRTFGAHCSGRSADLLGFEGDAADGRQLFWQRVHPDDRAAVERGFQTALASAELTWSHEFRLLGADGVGHTVLASTHLLRDECGAAIRCIGAIRDVTHERTRQRALVDEATALASLVDERTRELRRANEALRDAMRHKDQFLSSMSHELRSPLNTILGFAESFEEGLYGPLTDAQRQAIGDIVGSGQHLLSLINDLLDLAKIEAGKLHPEPAVVDLVGLARTVVRRLRPLADRKGLALRLSIGEGVDTTCTDGRMLTQILLNLLDNAVKFTEPGGEISLDLRAHGDRGAVQFQISDTGIGIAASDIDRLFRPFEQVDGGLSKRHDGTGLGLALADRISRALGGSMDVWSAPGVGSRFTLMLAPFLAEAS